MLYYTMCEKLKSYKETQYTIRILELEKRILELELELEKHKNCIEDAPKASYITGCSTPCICIESRQKIQNVLDYYNEDILDENDFNYHERIFKNL